jgi:hypothetical protein
MKNWTNYDIKKKLEVCVNKRICNIIWKEKEESVIRQVSFSPSLSLLLSYSLLILFTTIYGTRVEREYCHFFHNRILIVPLAFFRSGKQQDGEEQRKRDDAEQMLSTFNFSFPLS